MHKRTREAEFDQIIAFMDPFLDHLIEIYSDPRRRSKYAKESFNYLLSQGVPDWHKHYEKGGPVGFLGFMLKLSGIDQSSLNVSDPIGMIRQFGDLPAKLTATNARSDDIAKNVQDMILEISQGMLTLINDAVSALHYGETISELIPKARDGDDSALMKILRVDKSLISADWVSGRIRKAQILSDRKFFGRLGTAIAGSPGTGRKKHLKMSLLLAVLWHNGMEEMSRREIFDFLEKRGLYGNQFDVHDVQALTQLMNRLGLRKKRTRK